MSSYQKRCANTSTVAGMKKLYALSLSADSILIQSDIDNCILTNTLEICGRKHTLDNNAKIDD